LWVGFQLDFPSEYSPFPGKFLSQAELKPYNISKENSRDKHLLIEKNSVKTKFSIHLMLSPNPLSCNGETSEHKNYFLRFPTDLFITKLKEFKEQY
jgi:hypothetical protein